jgi:DNA-binding MarR family transcriptional regulator
MGFGIPLTDLERRFLYGLASRPDLGDGELEAEFGIKRSTATVIRSRLREEGYFSVVNIPDFGRLGCELFNVHYAHLNPLGDRADWWRRLQGAGYFGNAFLYLGSSQYDALFTAAANFTDVKAGGDEVLRLSMEGDGLYEDHPASVYFPLSLSKVFLFIEFSGLIGDLFGFEPAPKRAEFGRKSPGKAKLTKTEKQVLCGLVEHPELSEDEVGGKLGLSRQTVNKASRRMRQEGLVEKRLIPDLRRLGLELVTFTHTTYNPRTPIRARAEGIARIVGDTSQFYVASTDTESVRLSAFRDYREFQDKYNAYIRHYRSSGYILANPAIRVYPLKDPAFAFYANFHRPLRRILGLEGE